MSHVISRRPLLLPLNPLYRFGLALREFRLSSGLERVRRLRYPVISIGNLSTGGSGKTPLTIALARALTKRGVHVDVLSRGYGRQSTVPARVSVRGAANEFGDEPLLIARSTGLPVFVARRRYDAGMLAESEALSSVLPESHLTVHLLDDGSQHRQLHRDIDILLLQRADLRERLLPAGNLREPLRAIERADILAIPASEPGLESDFRARGFQGPIWHLHRHMDVPSVHGPAIAFCGIARPEQFFAGLESSGVPLVGRVAFRDHHRYTPHDIANLVKTASAAKAIALLTTEKDAVRLGNSAASLPTYLPLITVPLRSEIDGEAAAIDGLLAQLARSLPPSSL